MGLKSEILAFLFGILLILLTFGDSRFHIPKTGSAIGNLDSIFGPLFWPVLDIIYPLATITVFLLYGWSKQEKLRINPSTILLFLSFLAVLMLMIIDDIAGGIGLYAIHLPQLYWDIISAVYPIYSALAFFLFGKAHAKREE